MHEGVCCTLNADRGAGCLYAAPFPFSQALRMKIPIPEIIAAGIFTVAQVGQTTPHALFAWLGSAAFLVILANQVFTFWRNATGNLKEQPRPADTYQTLAMCDALHEASERKISALETQLDTRIDGLAKDVHDLRLEIKGDISRLQDSQGEILKSLIRLEGVKL